MDMEIKMESKHWNVWNDHDIYEMLHFISDRFYGVACSQCKTSCCANQMLEVHTDETKTLAKHLKMKSNEFRNKYTKTKQNYLKDMNAKVMSKNGEDMMKQPGRVLMFVESKDKIKLDAPIVVDGKSFTETGVSYCPFYEKETHRCNVHDARPQACRQYPFGRVGREAMEVRKVTKCVITDKFLERFIDFTSNVKNEDVRAFAKATKEELAKKEYCNHFYLPFSLVLTYIGYEFYMRGMTDLGEDIMKRVAMELRACR